VNTKLNHVVVSANDLIKRVVKSIVAKRELSRDLFTGETHYLLYKKYMRGVIGDVMYSDNYVVVRTATVRKKRHTYYYWGDGFEECVKKQLSLFRDPLSEYSVSEIVDKCRDRGFRIVGTIDTWVIGVNDNGRLFVNDILHETREDLFGLLEDLGGYKTYSIKNDTLIVRVKPAVIPKSDREVRVDIFRYDIDLDRDLEVGDHAVLPIHGWYRVQGEVVFHYTSNVDSDEPKVVAGDMIRSMWAQIHTQVHELACRAVLDIVESAVNQLGFITEIPNNRESGLCQLYIPGIPRSYWGKIDSGVDKYLEKLVLSTLKLHGIISEDDDQAVRVDVERDEDSRFIRITVSIYIPQTTVYNQLMQYIISEIKKMIVEAIESKRRVTYRARVGDHKIEIESIPLEYSVVVTADRTLLKHVIGDINVEVRAVYPEGYIVLPGYKATISHHEHGVREVTFSIPGLVRFATTPISRLHVTRVNSIVVDQLFKQIVDKQHGESSGENQHN